MPGFTEAQRPEVARLFWAAFSGKLATLLGPAQKGERFICNVLEPGFAISAVDDDRLLGVAGFKTAQGGLVGGTLRDLARVYGWAGGLWRGVLLEQLERDLEPGQLLMDGIFVEERARGQGVGTALLGAVLAQARELGCREVRLDVIDTNPRARALYEREGFEARGTQPTGPLRYVFGFREATMMVRAV